MDNDEQAWHATYPGQWWLKGLEVESLRRCVQYEVAEATWAIREPVFQLEQKSLPGQIGFLSVDKIPYYSSTAKGQNSGVDATADARPEETTGGTRAANVARPAAATNSPSGRSKPLQRSRSFPQAVLEAT